MKKELNQITEEQVKKICSILGMEFVFFKCEESPIKMEKYVCDVVFVNKNTLRIFSSGIIILINQKFAIEPIPGNWRILDVTDYLRSENFNLQNKYEKVVMNHEDKLEIIKDYFNNISEEKLAEFTEIAKKYSDIGPTVKEYLSQLSGNYPVSDLSKLTSGKIWAKPEMFFSREKFHGIKLIDDANLNFSLIEVVEATEHPLKKVEEGIRVYRIEWGTGTFTIIREDTSFDQIEVSTNDTVLIKAGDYYKYQGKQLKLFEINIKHP